jgi:integrase
MASIYKRKSKDGKSFTWRVVIRIKGYPTICKTCSRKQEAEDWAQETEQNIKAGQFKIAMHKQQYTYGQLIERLYADGALEQHRSLKKTRSQFEYWKKRLGNYALIHITPEIINKERAELLETDSAKGTKRSPGTINRLMAVLSSTLNYAVKRLRWLSENPCANLTKLKDEGKRDKILQESEFAKLLKECRESKSPYLYCIVLIALTTGARQGEILNLHWDEINWERKQAHLRETKNGRSRNIVLVDPVIHELKKLYALRQPNKKLVFASLTTFGKIDIKKAWQAAARRANISITFHGLRHSYCSMAASQGASTLELMTGMGHRTMQTLMRYTHLETDLTRKFSNHISNRIFEEDPL